MNQCYSFEFITIKIIHETYKLLDEIEYLETQINDDNIWRHENLAFRKKLQNRFHYWTIN